MFLYYAEMFGTLLLLALVMGGIAGGITIGCLSLYHKIKESF